MRYLLLFIVLCAVSLPDPVRASTDPYKAKRNAYGMLVNTPVYDPHSRSYYELVDDERDYASAIAYARSKSFKGVRGRLATIHSKETQDFLIDVFRPRRNGEHWIGLRMYCFRRALIWSDGKKLERGKDYANWGREWHYRKNYIPCNRTQDVYGGGALVGFQGRMRWFMIHPRHAVNYMFVEYPTGKP